MADPLASLLRSHGGPILPALERLAPPPSEGLIGAEIEARSNPGDVVIELHGRGGWIARGAIERLRRAVAMESTALTRLVAELVLRPPDLRHLDAALNTLANQPRGSSGLRDSINAGFASRCAICGGPVLVDEFIWDGDAGVPSRRSYRCGHCRDQRGNEGRSVPVDREDAARAAALDAALPRAALLVRFPIPERDHPLPGTILDLYPPRALDAIASIVERIESDLRAPGIQAALRLAVVHMLLPASRLNSYPGRVAQLRISAGKIRPPGSRQWRERNPWLLFEEGFRSVRSFVQRMEGAVGSRAHARLGSDLESLLDGSANVVLRQGSASDLLRAPGPVRFSPRPQEPDPRTRVRLVLTQPPIHWTADSLGFAYLATSIAIGNEAALTLPLDALFRVQPRGEWAWDAAALRRALGNVRGVLAPDARVVLLLDRSVPGALVAGVLGGVGAGYRLLDAVLAETGDEITGTLEFGSREDAAPADRAAAPVAMAEADGPLQLKAVAGAVGDIAVAVLQARGEPARYERLLGEVLIGLDRAGHLGRIVGTPAVASARKAPASPVATAEMPGGMVAAAVVPGAMRNGEHGAGAFLATVDAAVLDPAGHDPAGHDAAGTDAAVAQPSGAAHIDGPASSPPPGRSWRDPERPVRPAPSLGLEARLGTWADGPGAEPFSGVLSSDPESGALDAAPSSPLAGHEPPSAMGVAGPLPATRDSGGSTAVAATDDFASTGNIAADAPAVPHVEGSVAGSEAVASWGADGTTADPVRLVLEIVTGELRRSDHPRLLELEPGRWWLRDARDVEAARPPLSDRLEWAVFSLLSTAGGISEAAFFRRIARMFRGHDTPDAEMVRACLESYQAPHPEAEGTFHTEDGLPARFEEHGATVGLLTELGHRLGLRCWISRREQRRPFREGTLADLLSDVEERVYLPLVCPGPADALEAVDCIWYLRGKATFLFEVEWTAMLSEPVLRRGARIPTNDQLVRFLVIPPERAALVRLKLARSPLLRERFEEGNWHILKTDHVRRLVGREEVSLDDLAPLLGLDPEIERRGEQLSFFG